MHLEDADLQATLDAIDEHGGVKPAARALGVAPVTVRYRRNLASSRGLLGTKPVLPGFRLSKATAITNADGEVVREFVQQKLGEGEEYEMPDGFALIRDSAFLDADGRRVGGWKISAPTKEAQLAAMRATVEAFKEEIPRATPQPVAWQGRADLLNMFAVTDLHFGALSWREETGSDYDLNIAEKLLMDWFAAAVHLAPRAETAILAQIGDLLHHDGMESKTPASGHVLDADSRLQKIIRVVIRCMRRIIDMLLETHAKVHVIMADANHDPAGGAWLREMFAAFYDNEPRITVDSSASTYYMYEFGNVSLFVHHGHRRKIETVDSVFAGKFREAYGRTKYSYAHLGHLHSNALKSTNLMEVERHETLAAPDAYAANGGWISNRSAKVITYHAEYGEVARYTLKPAMVAGLYRADNDNEPQAESEVA